MVNNQYGYSCQEKCNVNFGFPYKCDRITGLCKEGCKVGWKVITYNETKNEHSNCLTINKLCLTKKVTFVLKHNVKC